MRIIAEFEKGEGARHISHLDLMRAIQRAIRRSGIPAKYTAGFNPHLELAFASALSVGFAGDAEALDIAIDGEIEPEDFLKKVAPCMPRGLALRSAHAVSDHYPALMAILDSAQYRIDLRLWGVFDERTLSEKLANLFCEPVMAMKKGKAGTKEIDLRPMVLRIDVAGVKSEENATRARIDLRVTASSKKGSLNPDLLMPIVLSCFGAEGEYAVRRTALYAEKNGESVPLWTL